MSEIETALTEMATLIKTIAPTNPPGGRVWIHPTETSAITMVNLPAVIISKMNSEPGSWEAESYGVGQHNWEMLVAVYLEEGPIVVTNPDQTTIDAMKDANQWYKLMADLLFQNMTLNGSAQIIGDGEGKLFDYVTDNIIWEGRQYYGHLFLIPIQQVVIQGVGS